MDFFAEILPAWANPQCSNSRFCSPSQKAKTVAAAALAAAVSLPTPKLSGLRRRPCSPPRISVRPAFLFAPHRCACALFACVVCGSSAHAPSLHNLLPCSFLILHVQSYSARKRCRRVMSFRPHLPLVCPLFSLSLSSPSFQVVVAAAVVSPCQSPIANCQPGDHTSLIHLLNLSFSLSLCLPISSPFSSLTARVSPT